MPIKKYVLNQLNPVIIKNLSISIKRSDYDYSVVILDSLFFGVFKRRQ
jgi:hypothetical protein